MEGTINKIDLNDSPATVDKVKGIIETQLASGGYHHVNCNLCGRDEAALYALRLYPPPENEPFVVHWRRVRCRKCGLVYSNPQATEKTLKEFYNQVYEGTLPDETLDLQDLKTQYRSWWESLGERVKPGKFLDVGCNTGRLLRAGQDFNWDVYGIDLSPASINYGREKLGLKNLKLCDLFTASYSDNYFDCIHLWHVLEHVKDPLALLREIHRVLKPGKELLIGVPCVTDPIYYGFRFKNWIMRLPSPMSSDNAHTFEFTRSSLTGMLKKAGFDIKKLWLYYNPLDELLPEVGLKGKVIITLSWYLSKIYPGGYGHRIEAHAKK